MPKGESYSKITLDGHENIQEVHAENYLLLKVLKSRKHHCAQHVEVRLAYFRIFIFYIKIILFYVARARVSTQT